MKKGATGSAGGAGDHSFADSVLASTHQAVVVMGKYRQRIVYVNPAFVTITGYTFEEIRGKSLLHFRSGRHNRSFYRQIWRALEEKGFWFGEIWARRKNGDEYPTLHTISPICDSGNGRVTRYVSMFCDITAIKRQQLMLGDLAYHDPLTGLPNRLLLRDRLKHALSTHTRKSSRLAVLFIDLDNFKDVNDSCGHAVGDRLLVTVAGRLQSGLRTNDTVARLGGDEFIVIAEDCKSHDGIARIAEKTLQTLARPLSIEGHAISVEASIGIAVFPDDGEDIDAVLQAADEAMYEAKARAGSHYCFYRG